MKFEKVQIKVMRWFARVMAALILLMGLPFYFGYGNPLPFVNPDYTLGENIGLTLVPIMLLGLVVGWKYEKLGGYLVSVSLVVGFVLSLIFKFGFPINMLIALIPGVLYLLIGHSKK